MKYILKLIVIAFPLHIIGIYFCVVSTVDAVTNLESLSLRGVSEQHLFVDELMQHGLEPNAEMTIQAWVKRSSDEIFDQVIVGKYDGDADSSKRSYALALDGDGAGQINLLISDGITHDWLGVHQMVEIGEWHNVAVTYSTLTGEAKFFFDGIFIGKDTSDIQRIHDSIVPLRVGATKVGSGVGGFFDGLIDEVRVWSVARTGEEIRRDMRRVLTGSEPGLEGYWRMENDFNDLSPNGNHLIPVNGPTFSEDVPFFEDDVSEGEQPEAINASEELLNGLVSYWPMDEESGVRMDVHGVNSLDPRGIVSVGQGIVATSARFERVNKESFELGDGEQTGLEPSQISVSLWMNSTLSSADSGDASIVSKRSADGYQISLQDWGRLWWQINDQYLCTNEMSCGGEVREEYNDLDDSQWHHVVATYDGQNGKLFVDGNMVASKAWGPLEFDNMDPFFVGQISGTHFFDGSIDEVGFWNRALTAEEVAMLHNDGKGLPYGGGEEQDDAVSSVAFLPGIMGSRLYIEDGEGEERKRWESVLAGDIVALAMREDGTSQSTALYTRDVIDEIRPVDGLGSFGDAYGEWIDFMDDLVTEGTLKEWKALPYDWRLATDELFLHGRDLGEGRVSYVNPLPTEGEGAVPFLLSELSGLAQRSPTGKVTIVAHSNGGLVAKNLLRYLETTNHPLLKKIDALVLVASPQAGTPKALREMLHGMDMPAQQTLRDVVEDMPGAYGLLPSPHLMTLLTEPVVEASQTLRTLPLMQDMAGKNITTHDDLRKFLTGEIGTRAEVATLGYLHPNLLNAPLLASSTAMHAGVDKWKAPAGIRVVQMVGAGLWTPRGIAYSAYDRRTSSGTTLKSLRTDWLANMDGDGTVLARSAESGEADETYYLNMRRYNEFTQENYAHGNILSTTPAQALIESVVLKGLPNVPLHLGTTPEAERPPRFEARVYSPVDIHLYGGDGKHTGVTGELPTDLGRYYEAEIPNSYYEEWADVKYAGAVLSSKPIEIALDGTDEGEFTLEIDTYESGDQVVSYRWHHVPVRTASKGSLFVEEGGELKLAYDYDGDGDVDRTLASGEAFEPWMAYDVSFVGLREAIRDARMAKSLETWFLARVTLAQQLSKKSGKGNVVSAKVVLESVARSAELQSGKGLEPGAAKTIATLARAVGAGL